MVARQQFSIEEKWWCAAVQGEMDRAVEDARKRRLEEDM